MQSQLLVGDEVQLFTSRWEIGSSGAHTKKSGYPGTGFASVARTAAGKYTITFAKGMPVGGLEDLQVTHWSTVDAEPLVCGVKVGTYTAETLAAAATVKYETWVIDETAAQTELPDTDEVTIKAWFLKTKGA